MGICEFGLNVGTYSAKDKVLLRFEVRLHFDDSNRRFDKFRLPRPGSNAEVQAKWMTDSGKRTHWMIENISYLDALPATMGDADGSTPSTSASKRKRLFGSTATPGTETDNKKKSVGASSRKSVGERKASMQGIRNDSAVELGNLDEVPTPDASCAGPSCAGPSDRVVNDVDETAE
ncbi:uncharacterized protein EI90DRAFT_3031475 [Cantharellus anzutake]|uniref:uncharacterized protein n=1 Tax=Cantharellus anzutake TaxID=1750568 RepID=UPI0019051DFE|nr:uncharacterized protein EI90DRAFT_3031475 [Cantharellus anzutake]KAF8343141.1 hypothetical protein EI90DRAFT_3031475 [Cantharellus anzutake]